jgi:hypothetical protein
MGSCSTIIKKDKYNDEHCKLIDKIDKIDQLINIARTKKIKDGVCVISNRMISLDGKDIFYYVLFPLTRIKKDIMDGKSYDIRYHNDYTKNTITMNFMMQGKNAFNDEVHDYFLSDSSIKYTFLHVNAYKRERIVIINVDFEI